MRRESNAPVLAECRVEYYRISECFVVEKEEGADNFFLPGQRPTRSCNIKLCPWPLSAACLFPTMPAYQL